MSNEVTVIRTIVALIAAGALATAGCSNTTDSAASTLPTTPSSPLVTENFGGTVIVGGNDQHTFTVTSDAAPITIDLTSAGPPATITMGFGIGTIVAGTCQLSSGGYTQAPAGSVPQLQGTIAAGQYCFMVYDVGNESAPITYTAVVLHY
jgi:hypothetical protein